MFRTVYGAMFVALMVVALAVVAFHGSSFAGLAVKQFNFDWLLWSDSYRIGVLPFIGLLGFFCILERLLPPAGPAKSASGHLLNLNVTLLTWLVRPFAFSLTGVCLGYLNNYIGLGLIDLRLAEGSDIAKIVVAFVASLLISDFFYYWFHRFQHESRFLWQQHKLHHMDEQLSATTYFRSHWLELFLHAIAILLPVAVLFKFDPATGGFIGGALGLIGIAWPAFLHANLRVGFGWANRLITSPQVHRIHHSPLPEHRDRNYALYFPMFDVLFGTYFHARPDEFPPSGVHDEPDVRTLKEAIILPFREWRKMLSQWRSRRVSQGYESAR